MKKIFTFIFTLICATLLVSCGEDELKDKVASATMHDKALIGTWDFVSGGEKESAEDYEVYYGYFREDGTGHMERKRKGQSDYLDYADMLWTTSKGKLIMTDKDLITTIANYKVDGDRLETWMEGDNYHKVFKKR